MNVKITESWNPPMGGCDLQADEMSSGQQVFVYEQSGSHVAYFARKNEDMCMASSGFDRNGCIRVVPVGVGVVFFRGTKPWAKISM